MVRTPIGKKIGNALGVKGDESADASEASEKADAQAQAKAQEEADAKGNQEEENDDEIIRKAEALKKKREDAAKRAQEEADAKKPKPLTADDILKLTMQYPMLPVHHFTVIPVPNDDHKILIGWTIENMPILKIQASAKAMEDLEKHFVASE